MRNPNSFTDRHIRLLEAVRNKVQQINDPDPEIIFNELYEFYIRQTREFGRIPKIRFKPHSCQIKAELIRDAGLIDNTKEKELNNLRQKYGIAGARNKESRLFEAECFRTHKVDSANRARRIFITNTVKEKAHLFI